MATINPSIHQTPQDSASKREELSPRDALSARIASYANLEPGFNGHGGHAPALEDIHNAKDFIMEGIPEKGLDSVQTMVIGDGEIDFEWEGKEFYLEVSFVDGNISFFGDMPNDSRKVDGEGPYTGTLPAELKKFMTAIF